MEIVNKNQITLINKLYDDFRFNKDYYIDEIKKDSGYLTLRVLSGNDLESYIESVLRYVKNTKEYTFDQSFILNSLKGIYIRRYKDLKKTAEYGKKIMK